MPEDIVSRLNKAARIIRYQGQGGLEEASKIVGADLALAMFVEHLHDQYHYRMGTSEGVDARVEEVLRKEGLLKGFGVISE